MALFNPSTIATTLNISDAGQISYLGLALEFMTNFLSSKGLVFYSTDPSATVKRKESSDSRSIFSLDYCKNPVFTLKQYNSSGISTVKTLVLDVDYTLQKHSAAPNPVNCINLFTSISKPQFLEVSAIWGFGLESQLPADIKFVVIDIMKDVMKQYIQVTSSYNTNGLSKTATRIGDVSSSYSQPDSSGEFDLEKLIMGSSKLQKVLNRYINL